MTQETILLIDGSNLVFRMFFALEMSNLRDSEGNPTWAVYGTIKALFDAIEFSKPTACAVAFDLPEPNFRHEVFEDYKANRPDEMPDELKPQWPMVKELFYKLHVPVLEEAGFEADDMIGIMARKAESAGYKVVVLSGDKDLFQLVNENVSIAVPKRGGGLEIYDDALVIEKMGVKPTQITDYKGIAGDSSDNIPGVRGLGPKAATSLLAKYASLEEIYENINDVTPPKTKEKLIEQEDQARLSKHIATIIVDGSGVKNCDLSLEHCSLTLPDVNELISFLREKEFNTILRRLPVILKPFNGGELLKVDVGDLPEQEEYSPQKKEPASKVQVIKQERLEKLDTPLTDIQITPMLIVDEVSLNSLIAELKNLDCYAIDLETDGLNTLNCNIVGWAISYNTQKNDLDLGLKTAYIPVKHSNLQHLDSQTVVEKLKLILEDPTKLQIIQNAKFEQEIFIRYGIKPHGNFFDTMIASYIFNPSDKHGLKAQSKRIFQLRMKEIDEIIGTGKKQITIDLAPIIDVASYAATDAYITHKLYYYYKVKLDEREKKLLAEIEFPLVEALRDMELAGVKIDTSYLSKLSHQVHNKIEEVTKKVFELVNEEFNISSPKQLSVILFDKLGLPTVGKKNKSGGYSTDLGTLETLLHEYELSKEQRSLLTNILEYRTLTKLASTYIDNLPSLVSKETGRLHSDFNQVVTATGRLSSSNPNLQNIPIRSELGKEIRKSFVAKDGEYSLISADYSQIELRVLAHMAEEPALIDAFKLDQDIHKRTAMEIFGITEDEVDKEKRSIGKTLNFALIYMQGPFATAKQLGITMKEAKEFTWKYFQVFKNIKPFMENVLEFSHQNEYVETIFGRRRYFQNINSPNKILSKEEERQAFNAVIQGTAADIIKIAMVNLKTKLSGYKSRLVLQVHDELVIEAPNSELDEVKKIVQDTMSSAVKLKVPLLVDIGTANNWLDAG
jgi:DNA polymerase I